MSNHENIQRFHSVQLENDIEYAHRTAISAEKTAKVLSKQALKLVKTGKTSAVAKVRPGHLLNKEFSSEKPKYHDTPSVELATNAALREKETGIEVSVTGHRDFDFDYTAYDQLTIKKIDGEEISDNDSE